MMMATVEEEEVEVRVRGTKRAIASPHKELSDRDFSLMCGLLRDGTSWLIGVLLLLMGSGAILVRCQQLPSQHQMTSDAFLSEPLSGPLEKTMRRDSQLNQHDSFPNNTHPYNRRLRRSASKIQPLSRSAFQTAMGSVDDDWTLLDRRNSEGNLQDRSSPQKRFVREEKRDADNFRQQLHSSPSIAGKDNLATWNFENRSTGTWKKRVTVEERTKTWQHWTAPKDRKYLEVDDQLPRISLSAESPLDDDPFPDQVILERGSNLSSSSSAAAASATATAGDSISCDELLCQGGGLCSQDASSGKGHCRCPLGTSGTFCEKDLVVKFPRFSGTGFIAFPVLRGAHREFIIKIEFRPDSTDGLFLFSADHPSARFDFFSISIVNARIEFRFDCGSGMAVVRSSNFVELGKWNNVTVHRSEWNAWLRLNQGTQSRGKAKGQFSRINFREDLYLGGYFNLSKVNDRVGTNIGFSGCIRRLDINNHLYDMRKGAFIGDALRGIDVEDCSDDVCRNVSCQNGGLCVTDNADVAICHCPLGTTGDRCQSRVQVRGVPMFSGQSFLQYPGLQRNTLSFTEIEIVFKPMDVDGLILYNGFSRDRTGDFIDLAMKDGYVEYRFDLGTGPAVIRSAQPVSIGEWHFVRLSRTGRNGFLKVDRQQLVDGMASGAFTQLTLTLDLFIGGHRNYDEVAKAAQITKSFTGCIQKVVINKRPMKLMEEAITGLNVNNCNHPCVGQPCLYGGRCQPIHDRYTCSCPLRYANTNCEDKILGEISSPKFNGDSFLLYTNHFLSQKTRGRALDLQMRIRPRGPSGLLFWVSEEETGPHGDYLALGLRGGLVQLSYNLGSGEVVLVANQTRVDDDYWHTVKVQRFEKTASLEVDETDLVTGTSPGSMKQLTTHGTIFLGGMDDVVHGTLHKYTSGFVGCISNVTLGTDYRLDLVGFADDGSNISPCLDTAAERTDRR